MTYDEKVSYLTGRGTLVRTADFNSTSWFTEVDPSANNGIFLNAGHGPNALLPVQDNVIKASGHSSMKFTIMSQSGAGDSGSFYMNFSSDLATQFGSDQQFCVQWQQRFGPYFATHSYALTSGSGGWKQSIIGSGDQSGCSSAGTPPCYSSCSDLETVTQNTGQRGYPQMYNSCTGSSQKPAFDGFYEVFGGDFKMQNAMPSPYCLYNGGSTTGCFIYYPSEWITFTVYVNVGTKTSDYFASSHVDLYAARENAASQQLLNWGPYPLAAGSSGNQKFGKLWLLPYHTNKDSAEVHTTDYTWYANPIIATELIPLTTDESQSRLAVVLR